MNQERSKWTGGAFASRSLGYEFLLLVLSGLRPSCRGSLLLGSMRTLSSMPSAQTIVRTLQRLYETMNMPPLAT